MDKMIENLVIDSSIIFRDPQFIRNCEKLFTTNMILEEIKDRKTKTKLEIIPQNWMISDPSEDSTEKVIEYSKKIGEFKTLSKPDISIIALAVDLIQDLDDFKIDWDPKLPEIDSNSTKAVGEALPGFFKNPGDNDWIFPNNDKDIKEVKSSVVVATADKALQNTCLHLGITVVTDEGSVVKNIMNYVLLCSNCLRVCSDNSRTFCPFCGYNSLTKASKVTDELGNIKIIPPKSFNRFRKVDNSKMSSLKSLRKNGGVITNEVQLMKKAKKGLKKPSKVSEVVDCEGNPFKAFSSRDTNSRSFKHGYHLKKNQPALR